MLRRAYPPEPTPRHTIARQWWQEYDEWPEPCSIPISQQHCSRYHKTTNDKDWTATPPHPIIAPGRSFIFDYSSIYLVCILCVNSVYLVCILCVSCVYLVCILCVSCVYLVCILFVFLIQNIYFRYTNETSQIKSILWHE